MLVGISLEMLITLIVLGPAAILLILAIVYAMWLPKPAKAYISAKAGRKIVNADFTAAGGLEFETGKVEGTGVFRRKKYEEVNFIPLSTETWINQVFVADKIPTLLSLSSKGFSVSPVTIATLSLNQRLAEERMKEENQGKKDAVILANIVKRYVPHEPDKAKMLVYYLLSGKINIEDVESGNAEKLLQQQPTDAITEKLPKRTVKRKIAVLLDPRVLTNYMHKLIGQAQIQYVIKKAYNKGFNDGQAPLLQRALPAILVVGIVFALLALILGF